MVKTEQNNGVKNIYFKALKAIKEDIKRFKDNLLKKKII